MSKQLPDLPPFRVPGSPDHINDHDLFDVWLAAVRDAFYTGSEYDFPPIPDPAVHGNPGHVEAHNRLRACAEYMKATDYAGDDAFPPIPSAAAEGEQGHVVAHNEFRDVFAYIAAHRPKRFNSATGGTVTTVEDYNGTGQRWRVHTFTSSGTFTVQSGKLPFRVLVVGSGYHAESGSSDWSGHGGAGGKSLEVEQAEIGVGAHSVVVAAPSGKASSIVGITSSNGVSGGTRGANRNANNSGAGSGGRGGDGPYYYTTGSKVYYCGGGGGGANGGAYGGGYGGNRGGGKGQPTPNPKIHSDQYGHPNTGGGGGGGACPNGPGVPGGSGVVIVAYQIG